ncbi:MAG: hypothetical protein QM714_06410 [Nocardioides sp.]|uniref:hypothetical protein n=1 Tax=Nocardioides sp. TaxID=35761 RepID=UPI0039E5289A
MRTTVTLDPDTEQIVRERMKTKGLSFKQALNDSIRDGAHARPDYIFQTPTAPIGFTIDLTKANQVAAELENEEILAQMRAGQ